MLNDIVRDVSENLPQFNDYLLRQYIRQEIDRVPTYMDDIMKEAISLFNGKIKYLGSRIVPPEERHVYELRSKAHKCSVNVRRSELILTEYRFEFEGEEIVTYLYLPYLKDDKIVINGTAYAINLAISEVVFSRTMYGIIVKVLRSPINFWKNHSFKLVDLGPNGNDFTVPITTVKIYLKATNRGKVIPTLLHYWLARYGFEHTLEAFEIPSDSVKCMSQEEYEAEEKSEKYYYYDLKHNTTSKISNRLYMRVDKNIIEKEWGRRVIGNILYILHIYKNITLEDIYATGKDNLLWPLLLGKAICHGVNSEARIQRSTDMHMSTLETYLDATSRSRLHNMGIEVDSIYDLLRYMFFNIDRLIATHTHTNLFTKRFDILDNLLGVYIVAPIYISFYKIEVRNKNLDLDTVKRMLRMSPTLIHGIYKSDAANKSADAYGDNALLSIYARRVLMTSSGNGKKSTNKHSLTAPENRSDVSQITVQSYVTFSSNNPNHTGTIGPFTEIDKEGNILETDISKALAKELGPIMPHK